jgi:uncharacterized protein (TIGR03118 family)
MYALPHTRVLRRLTVGVALTLAVFTSSLYADQTTYQQHNLVSDQAGVADHTDPNLVNAWGLSFSSTSFFWVSDNGTGVATLYNGSGQSAPLPPAPPLVVTIPPTDSAPTGQVFNEFNATNPSEFVVTSGGGSGPSLFIFATEEGTIAGWNPAVPPPPLSTKAIQVVDSSPSGAVYKGLAIGANSHGHFLYATDFHNTKIDVFDTNFHSATLAGNFSDPKIPDGFAPFGIQNVNGDLYVTYAKQDADKHDDVAGQGNGFVDVFDTDGHFLQRVASRGQLNSPWGVAFAPKNFGQFSNDLLVGNFGNGHINAFRLEDQRFHFDGKLRGRKSKPIVIDGLWALQFGRGGANNGPTNVLFFTAGPDDEMHGLFGKIEPVL